MTSGALDTYPAGPRFAAVTGGSGGAALAATLYVGVGRLRPVFMLLYVAHLTVAYMYTTVRTWPGVTCSLDGRPRQYKYTDAPGWPWAPGAAQ